MAARWKFASWLSNCSNLINFEAKINCNTTRQNDLKCRKTCTGLKFDLLQFDCPQSHIIFVDHFEGPWSIKTWIMLHDVCVLYSPNSSPSEDPHPEGVWLCRSSLRSEQWLQASDPSPKALWVFVLSIRKGLEISGKYVRNGGGKSRFYIYFSVLPSWNRESKCQQLVIRINGGRGTNIIFITL